MKILHSIPVYAPAWQFGGPVLSVSRLCEALARQNHSIKVITTNTGLKESQIKLINQPVQRQGVEVTYFAAESNKKKIQSKALVKALPDILKGIDLIHLSGIWQPLGIQIQKEAYSNNIPVLHSLRGALGPYSRRHKWWKKLPYYWIQERPWLQRAAGLHVTTEQEKNEIKDLGLKAPCYVLPNPIDLDYLWINHKGGVTWRIKHKIDLNIPVFLICGRKHHKKGLDMLPDILEKLSDLSWHLLIVGDNDDQTGLKLSLELQRKGLRERVTELPSQPASKLNEIYNASDLLLLPSRHENFGNVVVEAMACGCAVLISDQTGVGGDLLNSAPSCFGAVLAREPKLWADWLKTWLQHHQRAGIQSAEWAAQRFSSSAVAMQAIAIYQEILGAQK